MKLVADSKKFSESKDTHGMLIMTISVLVFFVFPLSMAASPPSWLISFKPAFITGAICSTVFLFMLAIFFKSRGIVPGLPIRAYEEGVLVQHSMAALPTIVSYSDISTMELWFSEGKSGCVVLRRDGHKQKSVEMFRSKEALAGFLEIIRPSIEAAGFRAETEESGNSIRALFRRASSPAFGAE